MNGGRSEVDSIQDEDKDKGLLFNAIPEGIKYAGESIHMIQNIPGNIARSAGEKVSGVLETVDNALLTVKEYKGDVKKRIDAIGEIASFGGELTKAVAGPIVKGAIKASPTVMAAEIAADLAAETAAKAARAMPQLPQVPAAPALPAPPKTGGSNNKIGGLKRLVNEKKTIVKRIARTMKLFNRTNTRKRGRKGKSKRVRFAL
jgi:hypothetical protein